MPLRPSVLVVALLLLVGASAAPKTAPAQEPAAPAAQNWIKADSKVIAVIEVAKFLDGPEKDAIAELSSLHPVVLTSLLSEAEKTTGLRPSDVARLVVSEELPAGFIVAVETIGAPQSDLLRSKLAPAAAPASFANRTYYVGEQFALFPLEPQTILVSTPPVVEAVMTRLDAPGGATIDVPPLERADSAILDVVVKSSFLVEHPALAGAPPQVAALLKAEQMRIRFEPAKALTFRWNVQYADETDAESGVEALNFVAAQLVIYMAMCEQNMPPMLNGSIQEYPGAEKLAREFVQAVQAASAALQTASISREGANVSMVCTIRSDHPVTDAILLFSLIPRAAEK